MQIPRCNFSTLLLQILITQSYDMSMAQIRIYSVFIIVLVVAIMTTIHIAEVYKPRIEYKIGFDGNTRNDNTQIGFNGNNLLLSPAEMEQLLYNEGTPLNVLDWRYTNMIRSRMTRPNPSKPRNLANGNNQQFSEVRNPRVRLPVLSSPSYTLRDEHATYN